MRDEQGANERGGEAWVLKAGDWVRVGRLGRGILPPLYKRLSRSWGTHRTERVGVNPRENCSRMDNPEY